MQLSKRDMLITGVCFRKEKRNQYFLANFFVVSKYIYTRFQKRCDLKLYNKYIYTFSFLIKKNLTGVYIYIYSQGCKLMKDVKNVVDTPSHVTKSSIISVRYSHRGFEDFYVLFLHLC